MTAAMHRVSYRDYDALPGLRWSGLRIMAMNTPRHFAHHASTPRVDTDEFRLGRLVHQILLGGCEQFVAVGNRRYKTVRAEVSEAIDLGCTPISKKDYEAAHLMAEAVREDPDSRRLLTCDGANEISVTWSMSGTDLKCRIDRLIDGAVIEIKTANDASPRAMSRQIARLGYHGQIGCYLSGLDAISQRRRRAIIIAVEKSPPYAVGTYTLSDGAVAQGRAMFLRAIERHAYFRDAGVWPGYQAQEIDLPKWSQDHE